MRSRRRTASARRSIQARKYSASLPARTGRSGTPGRSGSCVRRRRRSAGRHAAGRTRAGRSSRCDRPGSPGRLRPRAGPVRAEHVATTRPLYSDLEPIERVLRFHPADDADARPASRMHGVRPAIGRATENSTNIGPSVTNVRPALQALDPVADRRTGRRASRRRGRSRAACWGSGSGSNRSRPRRGCGIRS